MKKNLKTDAKNAPVRIETPIVLTPEQIAEIAAGTVLRAGATTVSGGIRVKF